VAGYDLTFSPVKSVSTLWAIADQAVAAAIERAHQSAVKDALTYLEDHALLTREGRNGHPPGRRPAG
jgi:phage baseplate assembly protein W